MSNTPIADIRGASPCGFVLPGISSEVPIEFSRANSREQAMARFALAAERQGIALAGGAFTSTEDVCARQWQAFINNTLPTDGILEGEPSLEVHDELIGVYIVAQSNLSTLKARPVVEALESKLPGLGWYVYETIMQAVGAGINVYEPSMVAYHCDHLFWDLDEWTDLAYARKLLEEQGEAPSAEGPTEEAIAALREEYQLWPSDILASVGGHFHLLGMRSPGKPVDGKPAPFTREKAEKWLNRHAGDSHADCVRAALALDDACRAPTVGNFSWQINDDETEPLGAAFTLSWDCPRVLWEMVQHHEQYLLNGGCVAEAYARYEIETAAPDADYDALALSLKNYLHCWTCLERLLKHFPSAEETP